MKKCLESMKMIMMNTTKEFTEEEKADIRLINELVWEFRQLMYE